jgi:hypothetical protein
LRHSVGINEAISCHFIAFFEEVCSFFAKKGAIIAFFLVVSEKSSTFAPYFVRMCNQNQNKLITN